MKKYKIPEGYQKCSRPDCGWVVTKEELQDSAEILSVVPGTQVYRDVCITHRNELLTMGQAVRIL